jgi:hypothetical protein
VVLEGVDDPPPLIDPRSVRRWSERPRGCVGALHRCPGDPSRSNDTLRGTWHQDLSILTDAICIKFRGGGGDPGRCVDPFIDPRCGKRWSDGPKRCVGDLSRCPIHFSRLNDALRDTGHHNLSILTDAIYMRSRWGGGGPGRC